MKDYQKNFTVSKPVNEVYAAITQHIADWWSNDLWGQSTQIGHSFHIAFGETKKTFLLVESVPNEKLVWKCTAAHIDMEALKNKSEWIGTTIAWTLKSINQNTSSVEFLHQGLNESSECYHVCETGWDQFLSSLALYLHTGQGTPFTTKDLLKKTAG